MANYGQPAFKIGVTTTSTTGALVDMSGYITDFAGYSLEALTVQSDAFGDSWVETLYVGVRKGNAFTMSGFYDDISSGPHFYFGQTSCIGAERYMELDFGASDLATFKFIIQKYDRMPARGALTRFTVSCLPSGAVATAT